MDSAIIDIGMQISLLYIKLHPFVLIPRSGIAGSYDSQAASIPIAQQFIFPQCICFTLPLFVIIVILR